MLLSRSAIVPVLGLHNVPFFAVVVGAFQLLVPLSFLSFLI
jgi:hypothetical protein